MSHLILHCERCDDRFPAIALTSFSVEPQRPLCPACRVEREQRLDSSELADFLEQLAIETDDMGLWPDEERQTARTLLATMYVRVSMQRFAERFGQEAVRSFLEGRRRARFDAVRTGHHYGCHACGATTDLWRFPFAMAQVESKTRNWGPTVASAAVSVGMALLGGRGFLTGPSTTTQARICRMDLVLCGGCERKNTPRLMSRPSDKAYTLHPLWKVVEGMGYTKFLDPYTLAQFK